MMYGFLCYSKFHKYDWRVIKKPCLSFCHLKMCGIHIRNQYRNNFLKSDFFLQHYVTKRKSLSAPIFIVLAQFCSIWLFIELKWSFKNDCNWKRHNWFVYGKISCHKRSVWYKGYLLMDGYDLEFRQKQRVVMVFYSDWVWHNAEKMYVGLNLAIIKMMISSQLLTNDKSYYKALLRHIFCITVQKCPCVGYEHFNQA